VVRLFDIRLCRQQYRQVCGIEIEVRGGRFAAECPSLHQNETAHFSLVLPPPGLIPVAYLQAILVPSSRPVCPVDSTALTDQRHLKSFGKNEVPRKPCFAGTSPEKRRHVSEMPIIVQAATVLAGVFFSKSFAGSVSRYGWRGWFPHV
jgi:hypothetical protein